MPSVCSINKNAVEKQRRTALNEKISELQSIICPSTPDISRVEVLELAVSVLTGNVISNSSKPKNSSNRKEYKRDHEQFRRDKEASAYNELKKFITDKQLTGSRSSERLEKNTILALIINYLRSTGAPNVSTPSTSSAVFATPSSASTSSFQSATPSPSPLALLPATLSVPPPNTSPATSSAPPLAGLLANPLLPVIVPFFVLLPTPPATPAAPIAPVAPAAPRVSNVNFSISSILETSSTAAPINNANGSKDQDDSIIDIIN